jgi:hypothetical protein
MSTLELEKVTQPSPPLASTIGVPRTEAEYNELVKLLDHLTDEVEKVEIENRGEAGLLKS